MRLSGVRAALPLSPPSAFRFCLLSFVLHIYILLISAEALTSALFVVNQLTAEILLHVIHALVDFLKLPKDTKMSRQ